MIIADTKPLEHQEKRDVSRRGAEAQRMTENEIGTRVIEAAIAVHRELGLEEQPLRPCASAGEKQVSTTGGYVAGIPSP